MGGPVENIIRKYLGKIIPPGELIVFSSHFFSSAWMSTTIALLAALHSIWWITALCIPLSWTILAEAKGGRGIDWISRLGGILVGIIILIIILVC